MTFLCYSLIRSSHDHIERTYDIVTDLLVFDDRRVSLQRIIVGYLSKYKSQKFDLFPCAIDKKNKLKSKDEWAKKLDDLLYLRMNKIINEKGHAWWATSTKELVKVQLFFDSLKWDFVTIDNEVEYVLKKKNDILYFNWPDDTGFDTWMVDIAFDEKFQEVETDEEEGQDDEVQIIDTSILVLKDGEGEDH